jgi:hypothetical protein
LSGKKAGKSFDIKNQWRGIDDEDDENEKSSNDGSAGSGPGRALGACRRPSL